MADGPIKRKLSDEWLDSKTQGFISRKRRGRSYVGFYKSRRTRTYTYTPSFYYRKKVRQRINNALIYGEIEVGVVIIASKGGNPSHPGWYHILMNQSEVKVQVKNDVYQAKTRIISGDERESVWKMMAETLSSLTMIIKQRRSAIYR